MFLRRTQRRKDGKTHHYWNIVENRRLDEGHVVQRQVLSLGEIKSSQAAAWRKAIEVFDTDAGSGQTLALFTEDRCEAVADDAAVVRLRLSALRLCRPRQWGACWLAGLLWRDLGLDRFRAQRLPPSRKGTRWEQILQVLVTYRLIAPAFDKLRSEWRLHPEGLPLAYEVLPGKVPVQYLVGTPKGHGWRSTWSTSPGGRRARACRSSCWPRTASSTCSPTVTIALRQAQDRVSKERAMRRRQLKWLWKRLHKLAAMSVSREELLMKLGAARSKAPSAWRLVKTAVDKDSGALGFALDRKMINVHLPTTDGREIKLTRYTQPEPELQLLIAQMKLRLPPQPPPTITTADVARTTRRSEDLLV